MMKYFVLLIFSCFSLMSLSARQQITNPVLDQDFPDPTVIRAGDLYYAYATNSGGSDGFRHIQVASSGDLQHWTMLGDALPVKPRWADHDFWAPHVLYDSALRKYVLFYSGESKSKKVGKCLGVAFSNHPAGPFTDKGTPLLCGAGFVDIDPFAFIDPQSGKRLLYWGSGAQPIKVREMNADWTSFKANTTAVPLAWPGRENVYDKLIEGAWVDYHAGHYYLYFSGDNCCGENAHYAVMVARADKAMGPFTLMGTATGTKNSVILEASERWLAPGHNSLIRSGEGHTFIAYHAIARTGEGRHGRVFCISPLRYENGWPVVGATEKELSAVQEERK